MFGDVVDIGAHERFDLAPIGLLQRGKTAHIKRLEKMRRVRRHTKSHNIVIFTVFLEIQRVVALMAVNNKQAVGTHYLLLCMLIKVL